MPLRKCQHIRVSGTRCLAQAIADSSYCHWHHDLASRRAELSPNLTEKLCSMRPQHRDRSRLLRDKLMQDYFGIKAIGKGELTFPHLEDPDAIQFALSMVVDALGLDQIDIKRANTILYALQIATVNINRTTNAPIPKPEAPRLAATSTAEPAISPEVQPAPPAAPGPDSAERTDQA